MHQHDHAPTRPHAVDTLEEGELYVYRKGTLEHVQRDEEDTSHRIRITDDAYQQILNLQRTLRGAMNGYRPNIEIIASAVLFNYAQIPDAVSAVRTYGRNLFAQHDS